MGTRTNNVLLIGNGFDLAHDLKTNYKDFLFLMQNWDDFYFEYLKRDEPNSNAFKMLYNTYYSEKNPLTDDNNKKIHELLSSKDKFDTENIKMLGEIIKDNTWASYYSKCGAEIDGWIDFEREMIPVLDLFANIFNSQYNSYSRTISGMAFNRNNFGFINLFPKYMNCDTNFTYLNKEYSAQPYGILKKNLINDLKGDLKKFVEALEIYLKEFVNGKRDIKKLKQISEINADYVISFNYTLTERLYGIEEKNVHHIHGRIREDMSSSNNMVLGINERPNQNINFIYFVKYFQRIQKHLGTLYKDFINQKYYDSANDTEIYPQYNLHIYGHSLDATDEDILKYVIGDKNDQGKFELKAQKVYIYYYDQIDFEKKVISLINLYGRDIVEEYKENGKFDFIEIISD